MNDSDMKVVILAGGYGTRISEETDSKPKPMIEIGGRPILWHIMNLYSRHGFHDFVICLGYKGERVKQYFLQYSMLHSDLTIDLGKEGETRIHRPASEPWKITLVDTGLGTMTGGRVKRVRPYLADSPFLLTYGDGLSDIDMNRLVEFHRAHGKLATVTACQPPGRFGSLVLTDDNRVSSFTEKKPGEQGWVNAGFFVMQPEIFDYIHGDDTVLEKEPLEGLARDGQLAAFKHEGFWHPMDTLKDKKYLQQLWEENGAPWNG